MKSMNLPQKSAGTGGGSVLNPHYIRLAGRLSVFLLLIAIGTRSWKMMMEGEWNGTDARR
jgi:hypothetical protein